LTTSANGVARPTPRFLFSHPAHFLALGFGAGLSPVAPGTFGTLVALPLHLLLRRLLSDPVYLLVIAGMFAAGVWICGVAGRNLGVHDHGGIVWDEITAFLLVLFFVPAETAWEAFAFLLFRLFDILKPPPIRRVDQSVPGGLGVMLDDVVAAFYALLCLALWKVLTG